MLDPLVCNSLLRTTTKKKTLTVSRNTLGHRREKTCLRGFASTKAQTSIRIRADLSAPLLFALRKVSYLDLRQAKFLFSCKSL